MAVTIFDLSEDAATAILSHLPLVEYLPKAISSLRLASKDGTAWLSSDTVWTFLEASLPGSTGSAAPPTPSRRSSRLVLSSQQSFVAAWRLMLQRSEALHHAVAMAGQDDKDLTVEAASAHRQVGSAAPGDRPRLARLQCDAPHASLPWPRSRGQPHRLRGTAHLPRRLQSERAPAV